jgi:putative aldouronate transport system permease protein
MRSFIEEWTSISGSSSNSEVSWDNTQYGFSATSVVYSMVICAVIPILVIYPFIQKYFAKGVNMGGVKE